MHSTFETIFVFLASKIITKKMLENVGECLRMLGNVGECWGIMSGYVIHRTILNPTNKSQYDRI